MKLKQLTRVYILTSLSFLLLLALPAQASVVQQLSGTSIWGDGNDFGGGYLNGDIDALLTFTTRIDLRDSYSCDPDNGVCTEYYGGPVIGGTLALTEMFHPIEDPNLILTGHIIKGQMFGEIYYYDGFGSGLQQTDFSYEAFWNNGLWYSKGTVEEVCEPVEHNCRGTFTIVTQTTPEPGTILLLGSAILSFVGVVRRKLSETKKAA